MIVVTDVKAWVAPIATRIPFRYGIAEMTRAPHVLVQVEVLGQGGTSNGWASEHLPPKWFIKDPSLPFEAEVRILANSILAAAESARGRQAASAFDLVLELDHLQQARVTTGQFSGLVAGLGTSLVERAVIDAVCRAARTPFAQLLDSGALGFDASAIHPELAGEPKFHPSSHRRIAVRHTIGLADPLTDAEVTGDPQDGLPVSVESAINRYGVSRFKIKTAGDIDADIERIARLLKICVAHDLDARFTVDGNESMHTADQLVSWVERLISDPAIKDLMPRLDALEQPMHRDAALGEAARDALAQLAGSVPVIIDESDDSMDAVRCAMDIGYAGGTYKGCKGVFRGLANAALIAHRGQARRTVLTAEDLSTVPPLTVPQDLVVAEAMGLEHIERNGHHYFAKFAPVDPTLPLRALEAHPDLYEPAGGGARLRIRNGMLDLGTALAAPFGLAPEPRPAGMTALTPDAAAALTRADSES